MMPNATQYLKVTWLSWFTDKRIGLVSLRQWH